MRILIVNTSEDVGGAAQAAHRLMDALNNNGHKAKMLVREKCSENLTVVGIDRPLAAKWKFLWERLCIFFRLHLRRKNLFAIDIANTGFDITQMHEFREADVIHLHWINQGMLSLKGIKKILDTGKPVVWTMHDLWPATAICHLSLDCKHFQDKCGNCMLLPGGGADKDLSSKIWKRKKNLYDGANIQFVTCSGWLENQARQSSMLSNSFITSIPNPIDNRIFHDYDKDAARREFNLPLDKKLILFVAQRVTNQFKGMDYLIAACKKMVELHPETQNDVSMLIMGGDSEQIVAQLPFTAYSLGYVRDSVEIMKIYNASDTFVLPSLSENLPNTIMEAMACGVPCVGFNVGGIPEMIEHHITGYVAKYKDSDDLAEGIYNTLYVYDREAMSTAALIKVNRSYSQSAVALQYTEVYNEALLRSKGES